MENIKGYITDLDGTLFDTKTANIVSYEQALRDAGLDFDAATYESAFGLRFDEMIKLVAPHATEEQKKQVQERKKEHYANNLDLVRVNEALVAILAQAKEDGHRVALASTARAVNGQNVLRHFSLESLFDVTLFGEDVENGKPDPECYNKTISALGLKASECVIFEDSDIGVRAAQASGATVLKVTL